MNRWPLNPTPITISAAAGRAGASLAANLVCSGRTDTHHDHHPKDNEERNALLRSLGVEPDYKMQAVEESDALDLLLDFFADEKKAQVVRLRKELEDRLAMRDLNSVDADAIDRLRKEMEDATKRILTPEEGLQYEVYAVRKAAEEEAARVRHDQGLTPEQRAAALGGMRQETERSIRAVLGETGWEQFNRGANQR